MEKCWAVPPILVRESVEPELHVIDKLVHKDTWETALHSDDLRVH